MACEVCNDKGWILSWNTEEDFNEIQKCDECEIYKTDKEAAYHAIKELLTPHKEELEKAYQRGYDMACWDKHCAANVKMSMFSLFLIPDEYRDGMSLNTATLFNTTVICIAKGIIGSRALKVNKMSTPNEEIEDKAMEKMLKDADLDDYHFIIKFGCKRKEE